MTEDVEDVEDGESSGGLDDMTEDVEDVEDGESSGGLDDMTEEVEHVETAATRDPEVEPVEPSGPDDMTQEVEHVAYDGHFAAIVEEHIKRWVGYICVHIGSCPRRSRS